MPDPGPDPRPRRAFVFEAAPFPEAHASTIAEIAPSRLACAWFGGTREGAADVRIWLALAAGDGWREPRPVASGSGPRGLPLPCWNPVLFQPRTGPLLLFYKVGPSPKLWWGMVMRSADGGLSWSPAERLPRGIYGPIRSKPIELRDGTLVCPSSTELFGWRCRMELTRDHGRTWSRSPILNPFLSFRANQPTMLRHADGRLQALCRSKERKIVESWSSDGGRTWSRMRATALPNPNSGIDALTLADGRHLLVYNQSRTARTPLGVALSEDGRAWRDLLVLEDDPGEYSYPAIVQGNDGRVHITYTWRRQRIRHVVIERVPG